MAYVLACLAAVQQLMLSSMSSASLHDPEDGECFHEDEASWAIKKWILTDVPEEKFETSMFKYFDTDLTFVKTEEEGPSWYIVGGGWQGAFYYETAKDGMDRAGAYLFPDYRTTIVGVWDNHLLVNGRATTIGEACWHKDSWTLKFGELTGPPLQYSPPSHYSLGIDPLLRLAYF